MGTVRRRILECRPGRVDEKEIQVVRETPLTVRLNSRELVTLLCDGENFRELALGFLYNEGLLERETALGRVAVNEKTGEADVEAKVDERLLTAIHGKRLVTTGCGKGSVFYHVLDSVKAGRVQIAGDLRLPLSFLIEQGRVLAGRSETHRQTRGTHGAALLDRAGVVCFREDIGRHNALDKLAGWLLTERRDPAELALYTTGRVTSEVVLKAARLGTPIIASRAMPTELALQLAEQIGLTVVCALRGSSCLVVLGPERIDLEG
ncbi:MAG: formate dehydrogenase accessory sulfurtransferase FdhD [Myxococcales bacterium]|nr:formate dehydrogenase accessory sulfurtransferase FdhD [Myxococcales bacterium]